MTVILLGISFLIVYGLSLLENTYKDNGYISILISLIISFVNVILGIVIRYLTSFERDWT